ncbi:DinB family protein [Pseudochryseolinea flava]|uniref:Damage-inducible protein DinB n=1 Tax=Pseudochryseolinea flava TaxID=2059302 RepID=A0A364Y755_9BACT|nr:DinB family protein [Pseudochryseolinea flava]RAW02936.1 damage-inducible protein DinB [Pseudochryseolinea flava]
MSLKKLISNFASYNVWANTTLVTWLKTKPATSWDKEVASSFSSITKTIVHIWDTERFWNCVLKQIPPPPSFRFVEYTGTPIEAMDALVAQSIEIEEYVNSLSEEELADLRFLDTPWVKGELPQYEFIQHVFTHSTYHRGQVVTIGRHAGLEDAPMTDYNFFNMAVDKLAFKNELKVA